MIDLTPILQTVISLVATITTAMVIPFIKNKINAQNLECMKSWARIAVEAAEQIYPGSSGSAKKAYVLDFLCKHGVTVDEGTLDALVESAVKSLNSLKYAIEGDA